MFKLYCKFQLIFKYNTRITSIISYDNNLNFLLKHLFTFCYISPPPYHNHRLCANLFTCVSLFNFHLTFVSFTSFLGLLASYDRQASRATDKWQNNWKLKDKKIWANKFYSNKNAHLVVVANIQKIEINISIVKATTFNPAQRTFITEENCVWLCVYVFDKARLSKQLEILKGKAGKNDNALFYVSV